MESEGQTTDSWLLFSPAPVRKKGFRYKGYLLTFLFLQTLIERKLGNCFSIPHSLGKMLSDNKGEYTAFEILDAAGTIFQEIA